MSLELSPRASTQGPVGVLLVHHWNLVFRALVYPVEAIVAEKPGQIEFVSPEGVVVGTADAPVQGYSLENRMFGRFVVLLEGETGFPQSGTVPVPVVKVDFTLPVAE